ncbi:hypothetical protein NLJ89_g7642 [Agrocybe chaxingu]|uniref:pyranose dehydrogenase (acceptor) n=1 Tax=Agrocybe chaxingu TaxID=84603 RepID=A0A9W8MRJ9_9AGAR|nr:hypothetical protein NLJ89_g7642 [Agrocybe chaxingu]
MTRLKSLSLVFSPLFVLFSAVYGYVDPLEGLRARQIDPGQLGGAYDYIVVGGGQSGLVIANRLSEDTERSILVIEYGYFNNNPRQLDPPTTPTSQQPRVLAASVVGGGSVVNGMLLDRAAADDYDMWEKLGNPGWGWDGLLPYFKKATTLNPPRPDLAAEFNITYDINRAYGNGPIQGTFPDFLWPGLKIQWDAWKDLGVQIHAEGAAGDAYGAYWSPSATDTEYRRSYARNRYYDPVSNRPNLHLLIGHRVNEVLFDAHRRAEAVTIQERGSFTGSPTITVKATQEIILCSGWLHTPQILHRSGIGPGALLRQAGIKVLVDLPGVGSNHQEHPYFFGQFSYQTDVTPNPTTLATNETFRKWADELWQQRKGPRSIGLGNSLATLPLSVLSRRSQAIIRKAKSQNASTYLPKTYTAEQIKGFIAQRDIMLPSFVKQDNGVVEIPFSGASASILVLMKPLSRGTVLLNVTDKYAEPIVDFNANVNPVDIDIFTDALRFYRRWMRTPSMSQLTPIELVPGANVTTDKEIGDFVARSTIASIGHSCCTAAMLPRELAGVVTPQLTVYSVTGLSIGDISIMPLDPATHTCATVYAIAEKFVNRGRSSRYVSRDKQAQALISFSHSLLLQAFFLVGGLVCVDTIAQSSSPFVASIRGRPLLVFRRLGSTICPPHLQGSTARPLWPPSVMAHPTRILQTATLSLSDVPRNSLNIWETFVHIDASGLSGAYLDSAQMWQDSEKGGSRGCLVVRAVTRTIGDWVGG